MTWNYTKRFLSSDCM